MLRRKEEASPLAEHWKEVHSNQQEAPKFKFKVLGTHKTALERQLQEGLAIARDCIEFQK